MNQSGKKLEEYIAAKVREIDPKARPTKASGASTEIADTLSKLFYVECKKRNTKNVTIVRKVWIEFLAKLANPQKVPIMALENNQGDRFIVMDCEDFFRLAKRAFQNG